MSGYHNNNQRYTSNAGRAPNPANNRQAPKELRGGGNGIYCYGCSKTKPHQEFSETQLKKAANRNPNKAHQIMCKNCIPAQTTSLKCYTCSKTLALSEFSKTQRRRQERATCMECREILSKEDSEEDLDIDEDDPEWNDVSIHDVL
ncbi:hypothetical protein B0O80DRAFT_493371 [Mortierella sp. GBAus27b]|nr:hypothetical protein BGX31_006566 [Mortierella sp. GBA43]KAI8362382.1 hypothetical protein B0O80DRAFT_493371 [Mortierella sp. GBAus27b]